MDPTLKAAWIADLRAHPELQGRMRLRTSDDKFCCLGRLREVAGFPWMDAPDWSGPGFCTPGCLVGLLDSEEATAVGISLFAIDQLVGMNDSGRTFAEIADWIEANL